MICPYPHTHVMLQQFILLFVLFNVIIEIQKKKMAKNNKNRHHQPTPHQQRGPKIKIEEDTLIERIEEYMETNDKTSISEKEILPLCTSLRKSHEKDYKQIPLADFKEICLIAVDKILGQDESSSSSSEDEKLTKEEEEKRLKNLAKLKDMINNEKNSINQQLQNVYKEQSTTLPVL